MTAMLHEFSQHDVYNEKLFLKTGKKNNAMRLQFIHSYPTGSKEFVLGFEIKIVQES